MMYNYIKCCAISNVYVMTNVFRLNVLLSINEMNDVKVSAKCLLIKKLMLSEQN